MNRTMVISDLIEKRAKANELAVLNVDHGGIQEEILKLGAQNGIYSDFCKNSPVDVCNGRGTCQSNFFGYVRLSTLKIMYRVGAKGV